MDRDVLVSIIIPAYNEEDALEKTVAEVKKLSINKEIIVIDDGSKDNTAAIARRIPQIKLIEHKLNKGRGAAIKSGIANSSGSIICTQDADMEQLPSDIPRMIQPIIDGQADVVYGSRFRNPKNAKTSTTLRILGNKFFAFLGDFLFGQQLTDIYTGSKCYSRRVFERIQLDSDGFEQEVEILAKVSRKGLKVFEIPIQYSFRTAGVSKMKLRDGIKGAYTIIKYFFKTLGIKEKGKCRS